jgi:hypothetical protein
MTMRLAVKVIGVVTLASVTFRTFSAETIQIPNGSFESPSTTYASPFIDDWQKTARPDWYDEGSGAFLWTQLTGEFKNLPPGSPGYIDNCDGDQGAWMFVIPQVGIFQDYDSPSNHSFHATYEVGKSYHLTVGIIGTGGNMMVGASFELGLYYRDAASNMIFVAATSVTNLPTVFSNNTHFIDFRADTAGVRPSAPWAGQHIGVGLFSTITDTNMEGGYWDLDNVRLTSILEPSLSNPLWSNNQLSFAIQSEPGMVFQILKTTSLPGDNPVNASWSSAGFLTNTSGTTLFTDTNAVSGQSYYQARSIP